MMILDRIKIIINNYGAILIYIGIGLVIYLYFNQPKTLPSNITDNSEIYTKRDLVIQEVANKYETSLDWDENLKYTIQIQESLKSGKQFLFIGTIEDIYNDNDKTYLRFLSIVSSVNFDIVLDLECKRQLIDSILFSKTDEDYSEYGDYIVVASITNVTRPIFALDTSVSDVDDYPGEHEVEFYVGKPSTILAKGSCTEIKYIGDISETVE